MKVNSLVSLAAAAAGVARAASSSDDDLALFAKRRTADLAQFPDPTWFAKIDTWLSSQKDDGTWSDVNYLSGCPAQRANWPIQEHWNRLITFGAAWSGVNPVVSSSWAKDPKLLAAVQKGLDYWFSNDYTPADCMGDGGDASKGCPCGTPGLWNTNWYDQAILIPQLCSTACLLVKDANLTETQRAGCERIPYRAYALRDGTYGTGGRMTGANMVLVMQNSVTLALFTDNSTILADSMTRAMSVMTFEDTAGADGIHRDGTFLQHDGLLYNGNYGKDLLNAFIQLEGEAIGTSFAADDDTREAMSTYIKGDEWMIYTDSETKTEHWDFNAIGRFVSFPTVDLQASADINFNVSKLAAAVADFTGSYAVNDTIRRLLSNGTEKLTGNKGFWASDYMVHRRPNFVLTNKMLSTRSANSESVNGANPYAYHMGQGTLYSYVTGTEYKDIMGAWDWNLVPGTTTLLDQPKLQASQVKYDGLKDFVGVVSDGKFGAAVEDYVDPLTQNLAYRKSWFFVDEGVIVITTDIKKNATAGNAPVITVLDNRAAESSKTKAFVKNGPLAKSGAVQHVATDTLYYANNGYLAYDTPFELTLSVGKRSGNWSEISTSTQGVETVDIFSAYTTIKGDKFTYGFFPSISSQKLNKELLEPTWTPITKKGISGIYGKDRASLAFWPGGAKSVELDLKDLGWASAGTLTFTSDQPAVYLLSAKCKDKGSLRLSVTLADPTQKLGAASYSIKISGQKHKVREMGKLSEGIERRGDGAIGFGVRLPTGGLAGSSVSREVVLELN
ncbi:polysaccharide lyase family 8 protein [Trichoderma reesei RUT C-30]|uniref:Polysaccharide lyase family 8 protein n=1 Tax=Hypocrea jecorina (strain ATCC 56765 / BCRC 32924 / NRRL 11460 / Rut C-30) TaxID=1344414 RepID=A0A024RY29_HYPJR|nr:polysaccharide lyase family 8 protein [Trichoderma reesei RUT C-30]